MSQLTFKKLNIRMHVYPQKKNKGRKKKHTQNIEGYFIQRKKEEEVDALAIFRIDTKT